jgi:hypothetical protein
VRVVGTALAEGNSLLEAGVTYRPEPWRESWNLINADLGRLSFSVYGFPVWIDFFFELDVGVEIAAEITASVELETEVEAAGSFDYTCNSGGCTGTNTFDSDDFGLGDLNAEVEARIEATAWAQPGLGAALYGSDWLAGGGVGLRGLLQAELWGYYGNGCGDADGDGSNEWVKALTAEASWGYDTLYFWTIFGDDHDSHDEGPRYTLGWWDLLDVLGLGKSTVLQPMLLGPAEVIADSGAHEYTVRMRPCYPYSDAVTFGITGPWTGTTTIPEPRSTDPARNSSVMARGFNNVGTYTTTVTAIEDDAGRDLDVPYTRDIVAIAGPPDIKVTLVGSQTQIPRNSTLDVGTTPFGQVLPTGIAVRNVGGETLVVQSVSVSGSSQFAVTTISSTQIPPDGVASFSVRLLATQSGGHTARVSIATNDPNENPYEFDVTGTVGVGPEIRVRLAGGTEVSDGGAHAFPPTPVGNLPLTATFEVWNDGAADLTLQNPNTLVSGTGFTQVGTAPSAVIAPGTHTTFKVRFQTVNPWRYTGAVTLHNNDANEGTYDIALSAAALGACMPDATTLCLRGGRFKAKVDHAGGAAQTRTHTDLGGFFSFFNAPNLEVGVKVLQPPGGSWWVFHGPATHVQYTLGVFDTQTGNLRTYVKPQGSFCGHADTGAFPPSFAEGGEGSVAAAAGYGAATGLALRIAAAPGGGGVEGLGNCTGGPTAVCLNNDRFKVEVLRNGVPEPAVELTALTGVFSFDNAQNPEVFVKTLGPVNGHYWVYYGSLTNQAFTIRVTDTGVTPNQVVTYDNPAGTYCGGYDQGSF